MFMKLSVGRIQTQLDFNKNLCQPLEKHYAGQFRGKPVAAADCFGAPLDFQWRPAQF